MKTLIAGGGEIGKSLGNILKQHYDTKIVDLKDYTDDKFDILHVCFPYSHSFIGAVRKYQSENEPNYTVIHSTVPVGTSRQLDAIHSPCIGLHPFLEESIKTFTKYLGGEDAGEVADYFRKANIKCYITDKQETTELMKIMSTTAHGLNIEYTKEVKKLCDEYGVPFEMWTLWTDNYNTGYETLGHPEYKRPNLIPIKNKIGGHCVLPNLDFIKSKFSDFIRSLNEKD